jgi:septum formation protein
LLASLGVAFDVVVASVDEHEAEDADPRALVHHNAALKATWVAARHPEALVLGADTTVFVDGTVLNKPTGLEDARRMLRLLSGRAHSVFTGLALRAHAAGLSEDHGVESRVFFRRLDETTIDRYLATAHALDKAGAYGIQDHGEIIIERWEGSLSNVIGLPVEETKAALTRLRMLPSSP